MSLKRLGNFDKVAEGSFAGNVMSVYYIAEDCSLEPTPGSASVYRLGAGVRLTKSVMSSYLIGSYAVQLTGEYVVFESHGTPFLDSDAHCQLIRLE
jgi:hypothetical protein